MLLKKRQSCPPGGTEKAIIPDFDKAFGQDVLQEAAHELEGSQGAAFDFTGLGIFVAKGDLSIFQFENELIAFCAPTSTA